MARFFVTGHSRYEPEYLRTMLSIFVVESVKEDKQRKHDRNPPTQMMDSQPKTCDRISVKELTIDTVLAKPTKTL